MTKQKEKTAYVCGPLTELPVDEQDLVKSFYRRVADVCESELGKRAFVPHEHYDPKENVAATPTDVDRAERKQVCKMTSILIVVAIAPSWGGGIEVEMANRSGVPVIILCELEKLRQRKISRLLRGNPAVVRLITYRSHAGALRKLQIILRSILKTQEVLF